MRSPEPSALQPPEVKHLAKLGKFLLREGSSLLDQVILVQAHEPRAGDSARPWQANPHDARGQPFLAAYWQFERDTGDVLVSRRHNVDRENVTLPTSGQDDHRGSVLAKCPPDLTTKWHVPVSRCERPRHPPAGSGRFPTPRSFPKAPYPGRVPCASNSPKPSMGSGGRVRRGQP